MALISGYHQSLERNIKTEIVFDKITDFQNSLKLNEYFNHEQMRCYSPETTYDTYLQSKLRYYSGKLFSEITTLSTAKDVIANENFKRIVDYGEVIIPHILNSLKKESSILIWALNAILKTKISSKPLSISEASKEWIKWGKANLLV